MKLSVIIPVYNVGEYLSQCLDSVLSQDIDDMEIICIDDCSKDNSYNILQKYAQLDSRIKVFKNEYNIGLGETRNKGLFASKGDYIHFLDSDDWLYNGVYQKLLSKISESNSEPDMLFFRYSTYNNETGEIKDINFKNNEILDVILCPKENLSAFDNWDRYAWLKLFKKSFLTDNNILFNNYPSMEDIEYSALIYTKADSLLYTDIPVLYYRINRNNSLSVLGFKDVRYIVKSFFHNKKLYENLSDDIKYTLLGFDYYQISSNLLRALNTHSISIFYAIRTVLRINTTDCNKYIYNRFREHEKCHKLRISLMKLLIKYYLPNIFNEIIKIKKRFKG